MMHIINPSNRQVVAKVSKSTRGDVDKAIASASKAFESGVWSGKSLPERAQVLLTAAALMAQNKGLLVYQESLTSGATITRTMQDSANEL